MGPNGERNDNYTEQKNRVIYQRPGAREYVQRIQSHPRAIFGYYASMLSHRCQSLAAVLPGEQPYEIFDQSHCSDFDEHPVLKNQKKNPWDQFIDIQKVLQSPCCTQQGIDQGKICFVGKSSAKMQCIIDNSIIVSPYTKGDVLGIAHSAKKPEIHDEAWQRGHMQELGDIVIDMLDNSDGDVRGFLRSEKLPASFRPVDLSTTIEVNKKKQAMNRVVIENFLKNPQFLFKDIPEGTKFIRFGEVPQNILVELVLRDETFFLEKDKKFKFNRKPTFKLAGGSSRCTSLIFTFLKQQKW